MRIDPNRLLRLGELIRKGSFKKAADGLTITQPALSQSIAQMESEVGVRLIDRTPHGVVPTVFGAALLRHAMEIERSEEHTSELQSLMRISYAVFCLKKKKTKTANDN